VLAAATPAAAQGFGVRLSGAIEEEVAWDRITTDSRHSETLSSGTRFAPNLDGFVLDPRLFVYSYSGSVLSRTTWGDETGESALTIEPYRLSITAFPYGLHTFNLSAARSTSEFEFVDGGSRITHDSWSVGWTQRAGGALPETSLTFTRETTSEEFLTGGTDERVRSILGFRAHKLFARAQPTFTYALELLEIDTTVPRPFFEEEGLIHRASYDDRIRLGDHAVLTPAFSLTAAPEGTDANAFATLTSAPSPTVDLSATLRYSLFERDHLSTQTVAAHGTLTKRFSERLTVTALTNGSYIFGPDGDNAWTAGGGLGVRAVPVEPLQALVDYNLQLSQSERFTTVSHSGHLGVATVGPRYTANADYFITSTSIASSGVDAEVVDAGDLGFRGHTLTLQASTAVIALTTLSAGYTFDMNEGTGHRRRHAGRVAAEVSPVPALGMRSGITGFTEEQTGGGAGRRSEIGAFADAAVTARVRSWLEVELGGRYGAKDVERQERAGRFTIAGANAAVGVSSRDVTGRAELFYEQDEDYQIDRRGVRGVAAYRLRAWTLSAEWEFSTQSAQEVSLVSQRALIRLSRPLNFAW
jgi:hypothetical protein